jgi:hypothetical protein
VAGVRVALAGKCWRRSVTTWEASRGVQHTQGEVWMATLLLWVVVFVLCWPLALLVLLLYPVFWLLLLPFRLLGIAVDGVFELLRAILTLPARLLGGGR